MTSSYSEARLKEAAWWRVNQKSIAETLLALHLLMQTASEKLLEQYDE